MSKNFPQIEVIDSAKFNISKFSAIAISIIPKDDKPQISNKALLKELNTKFDLDLLSEIKKWPDFTGKAGEIIEIPATLKKSGDFRIFLFGTGDARLEDVRKSEIGRAHV